MLYLIRIGIRGVPVGLLLWPGVAVDALLIVLLGSAWLNQRKNPAATQQHFHGLVFGTTCAE